MQVHEIKSPKGSRKRKLIVGRGRGTGNGKTAGRGENGQRSRSGKWYLGNSEGGQMPLVFRLPKVGFTCPTKKVNQIVSLSDLDKLDNGQIVTKAILKEHKIIDSARQPFKILNRGEINTAVIIKEGSVSKSAAEKIIKAGGKIELFEKLDTTKPKKG